MPAICPTRSLFAALAAAFLGCATPQPSALPETSRLLADGWAIRAASEVEAGGDRISQADYDAAGWIPARVPATVLGALVAQGAYEDPYFAMNLEKIPPRQLEVPGTYFVGALARGAGRMPASSLLRNEDP